MKQSVHSNHQHSPEKSPKQALAKNAKSRQSTEAIRHADSSPKTAPKQSPKTPKSKHSPYERTVKEEGKSTRHPLNGIYNGESLALFGLRSTVALEIEQLHKEKRELFLELQEEKKKRKSLESELKSLDAKAHSHTAILHDKFMSEKDSKKQRDQIIAQLKKENEKLVVQNNKLANALEELELQYSRLRVAWDREKWNSDEVKRILHQNRKLREEVELCKEQLKLSKEESRKLMTMEQDKLYRMQDELNSKTRAELEEALRSTIENRWDSELEELKAKTVMLLREKDKKIEELKLEKLEEMHEVINRMEDEFHRETSKLKALHEIELKETIERMKLEEQEKIELMENKLKVCENRLNEIILSKEKRIIELEEKLKQSGKLKDVEKWSQQTRKASTNKQPNNNTEISKLKEEFKSQLQKLENEWKEKEKSWMKEKKSLESKKGVSIPKKLDEEVPKEAEKITIKDGGLETHSENAEVKVYKIQL